MSQNLVWEVLVPVRSNDGLNRKIKKGYHREWDRKVRAITGGLTIMKPGRGHWIAPHGTLFREKMIPVRVMCDGFAIQQIAEITLKHYEQEAVFVTKIGEAHVFSRPVT